MRSCFYLSIISTTLITLFYFISFHLRGIALPSALLNILCQDLKRHQFVTFPTSSQITERVFIIMFVKLFNLTVAVRVRSTR